MASHYDPDRNELRAYDEYGYPIDGKFPHTYNARADQSEEKRRRKESEIRQATSNDFHSSQAKDVFNAPFNPLISFGGLFLVLAGLMGLLIALCWPIAWCLNLLGVTATYLPARVAVGVLALVVLSVWLVFVAHAIRTRDMSLESAGPIGILCIPFGGLLSLALFSSMPIALSFLALSIGFIVWPLVAFLVMGIRPLRGPLMFLPLIAVPVYAFRLYLNSLSSPTPELEELRAFSEFAFTHPLMVVGALLGCAIWVLGGLVFSVSALAVRYEKSKSAGQSSPPDNSY